MLDKFLNKLEEIHALSDGLRKTLEEKTEILEAQKGDIILKEGQVSNHVRAVLKGMLRSYYYVQDVEEVTSRFTTEGEVVLSVNSFYSRRPGYEFLIAEEDTIYASLPFEVQSQMLKDHLEYNYIVRLFTERYYATSEEHLFQLRKKTAKEKWVFFMETYPHLLQRASLSQIASFLGMRQETLSRVRSS